jgi:rhomboid protease GluP
MSETAVLPSSVHQEPPASVELPPKTAPYLSFGLLAILALVFLAELVFAVDPSSEPLTPSIKTLIAFGALQQELVFGHDQWWRMFTSPLLHANPIHLALNGLVLLLAGTVLERAVGRLWFGAIFVIGGLGGACGSLLINPRNLVSVGASGAIMGLFAAILVISFRYTSKQVRGQLQRRAFQVLIPSLLPLASAFEHGKIDYAAHAVGAVAGGVAAYFLSELWRDTDGLPGLRWTATAILFLGITGAATGAVEAGVTVRSLLSPAPLEPAQQLIPSEYLPKNPSDLHEASAWWYVAKYPADPRSHFYKALFLLKQPDLKEAERELRIALNQQPAFDKLLPRTFKPDVQGTLALVLLEEDQPDEARQAAEPPCHDPSSKIIPDLQAKGLCAGSN